MQRSFENYQEAWKRAAIASGSTQRPGAKPVPPALFLTEPMLVHEPRKRTTVFWLCLTLGWLGCHRFYVGRRGSGRLYLFTGGVYGLGVIVDLILILADSFEDGYGQPLA